MLLLMRRRPFRNPLPSGKLSIGPRAQPSHVRTRKENGTPSTIRESVWLGGCSVGPVLADIRRAEPSMSSVCRSSQIAAPLLSATRETSPVAMSMTMTPFPFEHTIRLPLGDQVPAGFQLQKGRNTRISVPSALATN
jgi:hypothetical protein